MSNSEQPKKKPGKPKTEGEILSGFHKLRSEQRLLTTKLAEMELEEHEHSIVLETLLGINGSRRCFRMVGGILCERTVSDVIVALKVNLEQIKKVVSTLNEQLVAKGVELNAYKDEYNVKIKGVSDLNQMNDEDSKTGPADGGGGAASSGVLVS